MPDSSRARLFFRPDGFVAHKHHTHKASPKQNDLRTTEKWALSIHGPQGDTYAIKSATLMCVNATHPRASAVVSVFAYSTMTVAIAPYICFSTVRSIALRFSFPVRTTTTNQQNKPRFAAVSIWDRPNSNSSVAPGCLPTMPNTYVSKSL